MAEKIPQRLITKTTWKKTRHTRGLRQTQDTRRSLRSSGRPINPLRAAASSPRNHVHNSAIRAENTIGLKIASAAPPRPPPHVITPDGAAVARFAASSVPARQSGAVLSVHKITHDAPARPARHL